jgi:hypothetical protein
LALLLVLLFEILFGPVPIVPILCEENGTAGVQNPGCQTWPPHKITKQGKNCKKRIWLRMTYDWITLTLTYLILKFDTGLQRLPMGILL